MKKVYYLLAFIGVAIAFTACNPLDKTYKELGDIPKPTAPVPPPNTGGSLTLSATDFALLPTTDYAKTSLSYKTKDDAAVSIPNILKLKYPAYSDKSSVTVTYNTYVVAPPAPVKLVDSVFTHLTYTLVNPDDYKLVLGASAKFFDLSPAQILTFLKTSPLYANPQENQLAILTYINFVSGASATVTESFLYLNGAWQNIYMVSPAQYTSVNKGGTNNDFAAADAANLPAYFSAFLKADPAVSVTAKIGDVKYVSYKYFQSASSPNPAITSQRVLPVTFDGTNWVTSPVTTPASLAFAKTNGVWVADNTQNYTLIAADYKYMGNNTTAGSVAGRANIVSFPDFNVSATTDPTYWSPTDIQGAIITFLKNKYGATAVANQKFVITYLQYFKGVTSNITITFKYDGANFVFVQ